MEQSYKDIKSDINLKKEKLIYFLSGEENYFIDQIQYHFEKEYLPLEEKDFNQILMYGKDVTVFDIIREVRTYPGMFGSKRLIIIKEFQNVKNIEELISIFEKPTVTSTLVMVNRGKGPLKTSAFYKKLSAKGNSQVVFFESKKIDNKAASLLAKDMLDAESKKFDPQVPQYLCDILDNDLEKIHNAIEKIIIAFDNDHKISLKDIQKHIDSEKKYSPFDFQKVVTKREVAKIAPMLEYFCDNINEFKFAIISILYKSFQRAMMVGRGVSSEKLELKSEWQMREFQEIYNHYGAKIPEVLQILGEFDLKLKGVDSYAEDKTLFREMIYRIVMI